MFFSRAATAILLFSSSAGVRAQSTTADGQTKAPQPGQLADSNAKAAVQLPNNAQVPPLTAGEKFNYRVIQIFGLRGSVGTVLSATISQATGTPQSWGGGAAGYGRRLGSAFGGNLSRQTFSFVLESALHEEPRYFPTTSHSFNYRVLNCLKQTLVTRTDAGKSSIAYARIGIAIAAGQLVNAWQPGSNGRVQDGFVRAVYSLGGDLGYNLLNEFFPFTRPRTLRHRP